MSEEIITKTKQALLQLQNFDIKTLSRENDLGKELNFANVVVAAKKLIDLYKLLPTDTLEYFPVQQLRQLLSLCNHDFEKLNKILQFSANIPNPINVRDNLITTIVDSYQKAYTDLHPFITFSICKSTDIQRLVTETNIKIQGIIQQANEATKELEEKKEQSKKILDDIKKVAAEQGVSQQAIYFNTESDEHKESASNWLISTCIFSSVLGLYSILTIFLHKIPVLAPENNFQNIQLTVSKILIFGVISFMLYLSARNYTTHKHNMVVNKHRENALKTYQSLVDASKNNDNKDIILTHASACIFSPQITGYTKNGNSSSKSVIELFSKQLLSPPE
jgi:hypothetical protein